VIGIGDRPHRRTAPLPVLLFALTAIVPAGPPSSAADDVTIVRRLDRDAGIVAPACGSCRDGDLLVTAGDLALVIGATPRPFRSFYGHSTADAMGTILSFAPRAGASPAETPRSDLMTGSPYLRHGDKSVFIAYRSIDRQPGSAGEAPAGSGADATTFVARAGHRIAGGPTIRIVTTYVLRPSTGTVDIESTVTNTGPGRWYDLRYALHMDAGQIYEFSPLDRARHPRLRFRVFPKPGHVLGWIDRNAEDAVGEPRFIWDGASILEEPKAVDLVPEQSHQVRYTLLAATRPGDLLKSIFKRLDVPARPASIRFEARGTGSIEVVVKDAATQAVFFRSFLGNHSPLDLWLPAGRYLARAHFFPGIDELPLQVSAGSRRPIVLREPSGGRVRVRLRDRTGAHVPGKVTFVGLDPTRTPYFRPHDPVRSGRYWESFKNSCFPAAEGTEVDLPAGTYLVAASRGPAFTLDQRTITVRGGFRLDLELTIDRVLDTRGLLSVDPHLHTLESDGAVTVAERVRSLVAEGVEVAIATDHNRLTDYRPAVKALGFEGELETVIGNEVTVPDLMDFNTYPVAPRAGAPEGGALDPRFGEAGPAFRAARDRDPAALVQVNHPRGWDYDFLNIYDLETGSAASARPGFDTSFDLFEAINGPRFDAEGNTAAVRDWMHLLNRGIYRPIVGSSDSHEIDGDEPGYSRTWVAYDRPATGSFDERALVEAMRRGRSFVSNGPVVRLTLDGTAGPGDLHPAPRGQARVAVRIQTAPWVAADSVDLVVNGDVRDTWPVRPEDRRGPEWRRESGLRFDRDAWIIAVVRGSRSLHPVVQNREAGDGPDRAPLPFAITNPIFVDVDGNGRFDPPLPTPIAPRPR